MFIFSKFVHFLLHPANLLLLLVAAGLLLRALGRRRTGGWLFGLAGALALLFGATPLGDALGHWLERRIAPGAYQLEQVAGAIVLGGAVGPPTEEAANNRYAVDGNVERLTTVIALRRERPDLPVLFTGGDASVTADGEPEARFARRFFEDMGLDPATITFEEKARNTYENATYAKALLRDRPGRYLLITSAAHMARSLGTFRQVFRDSGIELTPLPVDYGAKPPDWSLLRFHPAQRFNSVYRALREIVGMLYYRARGWSDAWLPDDR